MCTLTGTASGLEPTGNANRKPAVGPKLFASCAIAVAVGRSCGGNQIADNVEGVLYAHTHATKKKRNTKQTTKPVRHRVMSRLATSVTVGRECAWGHHDMRVHHNQNMHMRTFQAHPRDTNPLRRVNNHGKFYVLSSIYVNYVCMWHLSIPVSMMYSLKF